MSWLDIDLFLQHGPLGILTLFLLLAAYLINKAIKEIGRREDRAIEAIVNNTKAMQGVISIAGEIKETVSPCPRRLRLELEQAELGSTLLNRGKEEGTGGSEEGN